MPEKLHRCVNHVKGKADNPWAVCNASISEIDDIIKRNKNAFGHERTLEEITQGKTTAPMARDRSGNFTAPRASIHERN